MGIGTWQWGDRATWGYGGAYGASDVRAAFDVAIESGVRLFDTAELYGNGASERLLGRCLHETNAPEIQVATKFFPYPWRVLQPGALLRALRGSLGRLGLERVALYQIHWPLPFVGGDFWADELAEAVQSGLTERVGVSNYGVRGLDRVHAALAQRSIPLASNQIEYSLLQRGPERSGLLAACRDLNVTVIAYSPLAMGLLGGRYSAAHPPAGWRGLRARSSGRLRRLGRVLPALREIGAAHEQRSPSQVALNWLMSKGAMPIPGAKTAAQARDNAGALGWQLTPEEVDRLDRLSGP